LKYGIASGDLLARTLEARANSYVIRPDGGTATVWAQYEDRLRRMKQGLASHAPPPDDERQ
jgi:hypothetical protein